LPALAGAFRLLLPGSSSDTDAFAHMIAALAITWAAVWLLAPWLSRAGRWRNAAACTVTMLVAGAIAYLSYYGFWFSAGSTGMLLFTWAACSISLPPALALSGRCCRRSFRPRLVALWLLLWLPICTAVPLVVCLILIFLAVEQRLELVPMVVISSLFFSAFLSCFLYVLNLPVMLLAGFNGVYRDRMRAMICPEPAAEPVESGSPFGEAPVAGSS